MSGTQQYSCIVIGGGLSGLTLSIGLQLAGINVLLIEKEQYPFHRVCGEYISMESWDFLERTGVPLSSMSLPRIGKLRVSSPNGNVLTHRLAPGGFGISRYTLDHQLLQIARQRGVSVLENCKALDVRQEGDRFEVTTTRGIFYAPLVAGSWGKRSNLDVKLGRQFIRTEQRALSNYVAVKHHVKIALDPGTIELHNFRNGYCGVSKIEGDRYCLCYLVKGEELKKAGGSIPALQETVLRKNPHLDRHFGSAQWLYDKPLSISQVSFGPKTQSHNGILLPGDSAGLIAPLCGNGMSMAMHASVLLTQAIIRYFDNGLSREQLAAAYEASWKKQFGRRLATGRFIQGLFGNERLTNATIAMLKPLPFAVKALVSGTHGRSF